GWARRLYPRGSTGLGRDRTGLGREPLHQSRITGVVEGIDGTLAPPATQAAQQGVLQMETVHRHTDGGAVQFGHQQLRERGLSGTGGAHDAQDPAGAARQPACAVDQLGRGAGLGHHRPTGGRSARKLRGPNQPTRWAATRTASCTTPTDAPAIRPRRASEAAKSPWNVSPAPRVSRTGTAGTGT